MIEFLVLQVRMGKTSVEQLPEKYRSAVLARLSEEQNG